MNIKLHRIDKLHILQQIALTVLISPVPHLRTAHHRHTLQHKRIKIIHIKADRMEEDAEGLTTHLIGGIQVLVPTVLSMVMNLLVLHAGQGVISAISRGRQALAVVEGCNYRQRIDEKRQEALVHHLIQRKSKKRIHFDLRRACKQRT